MPECLLYVSRSQLRLPDEADQLIAIQTVSLARNSSLDLTGVLIGTPVYFTQYLEGARSSLDAVMQDIRADARHRDLRIVELERIESSRFPNWSMGCFAPASFVSRRLEPMLTRAHGALEIVKALEIVEFIRRLAPAFQRVPSF